MKNFRLVLLDHAKLQLDKPETKKILADMIIAKQKNFERTDENYITLDKHDMLGTHILLYDTSDLFNPKLIFTVRVTYQARAEISKVKTPMQELYPDLNEPCKAALDKFLQRYPLFVECNSLFAEPGYSQGRTGIHVTDVGFAAACAYMLSLGYNYFMACPNAKFKTQKFVEKFGSFSQDYKFVHPKIPDPHMLVLLENFNLSHIRDVYQKHQALLDNMLWVTASGLQPDSFGDFIRSAETVLPENLQAS
ncbi:MAG: hypothetical protein K0R29_1171 [Pseudobdellovibrio sp.]|jgi:hypothetical protein|nr:hypothetical protein [Pseudobdellovibrio sp.]